MKILRILVPIIFLVSCAKEVQFINKGKYDEAVDVLVEKMIDKPVKAKDLDALTFALNEANQKDIQTIKQLKTSGKPDIWHQVLNNYISLEKRQQKILTLPKVTLDSLNYEVVNFIPYISESREKACQFYYDEASKLLETGSAANRQRAYNNLVATQQLMPGFRDVEELLKQYEVDKPVEIVYEIRNEFDDYLPWRLEEELVYLDLSSFNSPRYLFKANDSKTNEGKYSAVIVVKDIKISPENTEELYYTETARLQDGIAYKLNDDGGFLLDSAGNKTEIPKFKTIACYVTETRQKKSLIIGGNVQIFNHATGQSFTGKYVTGESKFEHRSTKFKGELDALSPETLELIGSKELDYPSDLEMILRASDKFKINAVNEMIEVLEKLEMDVTKKE